MNHALDRIGRAVDRELMRQRDRGGYRAHGA
jgi:hypothetical protein